MFLCSFCCRNILFFLLQKHSFLSVAETSQNDYVLFQAASVIKESIVREWGMLSPTDIEALRSFLLQFVTKHARFVNLFTVHLRTEEKIDIFNPYERNLKGDIGILCSIGLSVCPSFLPSPPNTCVDREYRLHADCLLP